MSFTRYVTTLGWLLAMLCALGGAAFAAQQTITLREQVRQRYGPELLSYPFSAPRGACAAESVRVQGPRGAVPAQLTGVTYWPRTTSVRSARLCFLADGLEPLATDLYTVSYGPRRATLPAPPADLAVRQDGESIEITTAHVGVRLLNGGTRYPAPAAAVAVPGVLRGMRLAQGPWQGGSAFTGEGRVTAWSSRLVEGGPLVAKVECRYDFADGAVMTVTAQVTAGDSAVHWETHVSAANPAVTLEMRLPAVPGVKEAELPKGYGQWARDRTLPVTASADPLCYLSPDTSIVNINPDSPPTIRLIGAEGAELQLRSRDPGAWVEPGKPFTYAGHAAFSLDMVGELFKGWRDKRLPVRYAEDGTVTLGANLAAGWRKWSVSAGAPRVGIQLDWVKDLVLDWPQTTQHPHLFMSRAEIEAALRAKGAAEPVHWSQVTNPAMLKDMASWLERLGEYDVMRKVTDLEVAYDVLIDSDRVTPEERRVYRAQMAYLGYVLADPRCWSMERGYVSGNPNMSASYTLSLGLLACLLPDHPMARAWADYATGWMDHWLAAEVGENGEWRSEGVSYGGQVSYPPMLAYAIAARRAGFHDFAGDARLQKLALYFAKQYTPPDPRHAGKRLSPPVGRAHGWQTSGYHGAAATLFRESNPAASRALAWLWARGGYPTSMGDGRLGALNTLFLDTALPAEAPAWGSELFPRLGAVLRHGFNTPSEHYLNLLSHVESRHNLDVWTPGVGGINTWFAHGAPVSVSFDFAGGYHERHELLRDGVLLARWYDGAEQGKMPFGYYTTTHPEAFAALPAADYVRATYDITIPDDRPWFPEKMPATPKVTPATAPKLRWTRQTLFVKDADPAGPTWLLLRDTAAGGQPTLWQFWSLSEKIGAARQAGEPAFLAEKPGKTILPGRELPRSDQYTALGQLGVDLEFFVAAPADTPRATMRYGGKTLHIEEYQDLLQLRRAGDGAYYVAIFPRAAGTAAPAFASLDDGKIIKVSGEGWTDYALLAHEPVTAGGDDVAFAGTAGAVAARAAGVTLTLAASGEVRRGAYALSAPSAASLQITPRSAALLLPDGGAGGEFTVQLPDGWTLQAPPAGVTLTAEGPRSRIRVPAGIRRVVLGP